MRYISFSSSACQTLQVTTFIDFFGNILLMTVNMSESLLQKRIYRILTVNSKFCVENY